MAMRGRVRFKADDVWDAPEDENRYEVIDGELFVTPSPSWDHQLAASRLLLRIGEYVERHKIGKVVPAPLGVVLDAETAVQPDMVYVSRERAGIISRRGLEGAPDLVVEVLSPKMAARDRGIKLRHHAAAGIPHYWIVDPEARTIETYRLVEQGYVQTSACGSGAVLQPDLLAGLEITMDALWA